MVKINEDGRTSANDDSGGSQCDSIILGSTDKKYFNNEMSLSEHSRHNSEPRLTKSTREIFTSVSV